MVTDSTSPQTWNRAASDPPPEYGIYIVPDREVQFDVIASLIPISEQPFTVLDLGCGDGLLAERLLERFPTCTVHGVDESLELLQRAQQRLARFGERFEPQQADLASDAWHLPDSPVEAVVSALALHHLDSAQKQTLFEAVYQMLAPGGPFIIADLVEPAQQMGWRLAADAWDEAVRERALALDGSTEAFERFRRERWNTYRHFDPHDRDQPSQLRDQLTWLGHAGFADLDVHWMRAGHAVFSGWKPVTSVTQSAATAEPSLVEARGRQAKALRRVYISIFAGVLVLVAPVLVFAYTLVEPHIPGVPIRTCEDALLYVPGAAIIDRHNTSVDPPIEVMAPSVWEQPGDVGGSELCQPEPGSEVELLETYQLDSGERIILIDDGHGCRGWINEVWLTSADSEDS